MEKKHQPTTALRDGIIILINQAAYVKKKRWPTKSLGSSGDGDEKSCSKSTGGYHGWIVVTLADIASTPDLFEHVRQSFDCQCPLFYDLRGSNFKRFLCQSLVIAFPTSSCDAIFVL
ncbi:hypothetical protein TNCV_4640821 [Trichonephila clavipes]|nr:hypothetical protein TNCV_4640821 [Trichonephila clavipes]